MFHYKLASPQRKESVKIKFIPAIPRRPTIRILFPKILMDIDNLVKSLRLQNSRIPMENSVMLRKKESQMNNSPFQSEQAENKNQKKGEVLENMEHRVRSGVRDTKV